MNIDKDTWHVIHSYFDETPNYLTKHHIDSFNDFILNRIPLTFKIPFLKPQKIFIQDKKNPNIDYEMNVYYGGKSGKGIYMSKPTIYDALTQEMRPMYPNECRLKNLTYASDLFIDVDIDFSMYQDKKPIYENVPHPVPSILKKINLGRIPIMLRSKACVLHGATPEMLKQMGESEHEHGGYFIVDGMEKVVLSQERKAENKLYVLESKDDLYDYMAHVKSVPKDDFLYAKTTYVHMMAKTKSITVAVTYLKKGNKTFDIPLFTFFRALGVESDEEILKYILYDLDSEKAQHFMELLRPSIEESEQLGVYDQLSALTYLEKYPDKVSDDMERGGGEMKRNKLSRLSFLYDAIYKSLFPHVGNNFYKKAYYLGYVVNELLHVATGLKPQTDRDSWRYKRIDLSGFLLANLFREKVMKLSWTVRTQAETKYEFAHADFSGDNFVHIINETNIYEFFDYKIIDSGFKDAFKIGEITKKKGLIQSIQRLSNYWLVSYLRRVNTPDDLGTRMPIGQRLLHGTQYGLFCIAETPDGSNIGIKKHLTIMSHVTFGSSGSNLEKCIKKLGLLAIEDLHPSQTIGKTKIFINGDWIGVHEHPDKLVKTLKNMRRNGLINIYTSIAWRISDMEIHCYTDGGRGCFPLYIVENNRLLLTPEHVEGIRTGKYNWTHMINGFKNKKTKFDYFSDYLDPEDEGFDIKNLDEDLQKHRGIIEYMDTEEIDTCLLSPSITIPQNTLKKYTHSELHPALILGVQGNVIPFAHHSAAVRNVYGCGQTKQAVSYYVDNYRNRMETANLLYNPQKPLVGTRMRRHFYADELPTGQNVIVAISTYGGYNQEDSVIMNWSALQRGMFLSTYYKTFQKTEIEDTKTGNEEIFYNPLKMDEEEGEEMRFGRKYQGYTFEHLDEYGFIKEGTYLTGKEILIGAYAKIKNRDGRSENSDVSVPTKTQNAMVDKVFTCYTNNNRNRMCKVRTAQERMPEFGDKFACYDPETEILTKQRGWVAFPDLIADDEVATLVDGKYLQYEKPLELQSYDYNGEMYHIKSNQVDLMVTPNHRMYTRSKDVKSNYKVLEAKDIAGKKRKYKKNCEEYADYVDTKNFIIPAYLDSAPKTIDINNWIQFFGIWMAEGCYTNDMTISISANKQKVKDVLNLVVPAMGYELKKLFASPKDKEQHLYRVYNKQLTNYFKQFGGRTHTKFLPDWVWDLNTQQCRLLIHSLCLGNCHVMENGTLRYDTSSKELANDFQRLCIHAGWSASLKLKYKAGHETIVKTRGGEKLEKEEIIKSNYDAYRLTINKKQLEPIVNKTQKQDSWVDYEGKVYCCSVQSGIICVRRHNVPIMCGNSVHGQKGTIGMRFLAEDMPYTQGGISPDIIINPHAIPSRMTLGQLVECIFGKTCAELGYFGDGTPYNYVDKENIATILENNCGLQRYGDEILYNGLTGEQMKSTIFIGPTYYQRLKHMVRDKINARSSGSRDVFFNMPAQGGGYTARERQPPGGRALEGGLRIGEMERDCVLGYGMQTFLKESMMERSDKFSCFICDASGRLAVANQFDNSIYFSPDMDGPVTYHVTETAGTDIKQQADPNSYHKMVGVNILHQKAKNFSQIQVPYTFKLLIQECESIAISMRLISENNMYNFNQFPIDHKLLDFNPDIEGVKVRQESESIKLESFSESESIPDESDDKTEIKKKKKRRHKKEKKISESGKSIEEISNDLEPPEEEPNEEQSGGGNTETIDYNKEQSEGSQRKSLADIVGSMPESQMGGAEPNTEEGQLSPELTDESIQKASNTINVDTENVEGIKKNIDETTENYPGLNNPQKYTGDIIETASKKVNEITKPQPTDSGDIKTITVSQPLGTPNETPQQETPPDNSKPSMSGGRQQRYTNDRNQFGGHNDFGTESGDEETMQEVFL